MSEEARTTGYKPSEFDRKSTVQQLKERDASNSAFSVVSQPSHLTELPWIPSSGRDFAIPNSVLRKDSGFMTALTEQGLGKGTVFTDAYRRIIVSDTRWGSHQYEHGPGSSHIFFSVCRSGGGRYARVSDKQKLTGQFLPGAMYIALPHATGFIDFPSAQIATLGVTTSRLESLWKDMVPGTPLSSLDGSRFYRDPLATQLIVSTVEQAETHALSSFFFDHVLALLVHQITAQRQAVSRGTSGLSPRQLTLATDFIRDRLNEDIRLQEIANLVGLSVAEFGRRFRVSLGTPPYSYLMQQRMKFAMALMADPTLSIGEISARVGYSNPSQFARSFQRFSGLPPMKWRKTNSG
jgi:AraC family transcriptional regulator